MKIDAPDPIREYIYLGDTLLASLTLTTGTPVLTYYHTDALGSVRAITNSAGAPVLRYDFGPFGEGGSLQGDPRQFTGQERDGETALDYFHARYMRQVWGRFTTPDDSLYLNPYEPQSLNSYAYVWNNPLRWVDPSGHDKECPSRCIGVQPVTAFVIHDLKSLVEKSLWMNWLRWFAGRDLTDDEKQLATEVAVEASLPGTTVLGTAARVGPRVAVAASSRALAKNLGPRPLRVAAHHVVAGAARRAKEARAVLSRLGIGINDRLNGVYLDIELHAGIHTNKYYDYVNRALANATDRAQAEAILDGIKKLLLSRERVW